MGTCWYCHWGWAKTVSDIYREAQRRIDELEVRGTAHDPLHFGPSHIVWEDENFDSPEWCLEHFEDNHLTRTRYTAEELEIVRWSLEELAKLPLDQRCIEPKEYRLTDEEDPEAFPPSRGTEMARAESREKLRRLYEFAVEGQDPPTEAELREVEASWKEKP